MMGGEHWAHTYDRITKRKGLVRKNDNITLSTAYLHVLWYFSVISQDRHWLLATVDVNPGSFHVGTNWVIRERGPRYLTQS